VRILVTGSAGFIASHLVERFQAEHTVTGIDTLLTGRSANHPEYVDCDLSDRRLFYPVVNDLSPDLIIHCAASYANPDLWHRDTDTNVTGTINAVLAARYHGARLFYFQTSLPPISSYAISKIAGEQYIALSGVPAVIFRLGNIYGPRNLSGAIPAFYKRLTAGQPCTVTETRRDMVYIDALVEAVENAVMDTSLTGKFDICSGDPVTILDLYREVAAALNSDLEPEVIPKPADDVEMMDLDPTLARETLYLDTSTSLRDGIMDAVEWYDEHGVDQTFTHLTLKG
jgi:UDP-glucose 4-epimerase